MGSSKSKAPTLFVALGIPSMSLLTSGSGNSKSDEKIANQSTEFTRETPVIICEFEITGLSKKGSVMAFKYVADDTHGVAPDNYELAAVDLAIPKVKNYRGHSKVSSPNNGWPKGTYHIDILLNGEHMKRVDFTVTSSKSDGPLDVDRLKITITEFGLILQVHSHCKGSGETKEDKEVHTETDVFTPETPSIICRWELEGATQDFTIDVKWIAVDTNGAAPPNYSIATVELAVPACDKYNGMVKTSAPNNGWPKGSYHLQLCVEDKEILKKEFTVE